MSMEIYGFKPGDLCAYEDMAYAYKKTDSNFLVLRYLPSHPFAGMMDQPAYEVLFFSGPFAARNHGPILLTIRCAVLSQSRLLCRPDDGT